MTRSNDHAKGVLERIKGEDGRVAGGSRPL